MASGNESQLFERSKAMSVTVGDPDGESDEEEINLHQQIRNMALAEESPEAINFVSDSHVLPSTSTDEPDLFKTTFGEVINTEFQQVPQGMFEQLNQPKPSKVVNGYLFGEVLGEGAYSKVKEVIDTRSLIRRSIKIIKDKRLRKIPFGERNVQQEIHILKEVKHENVIRLLETFRVEEKQKLYLVMEYCTCSLQQLLDNSEGKRLPEFQVK